MLGGPCRAGREAVGGRSGWPPWTFGGARIAQPKEPHCGERVARMATLDFRRSMDSAAERAALPRAPRQGWRGWSRHEGWLEDRERDAWWAV